jgi:hypothetical protein
MDFIEVGNVISCSPSLLAKACSPIVTTESGRYISFKEKRFASTPSIGLKALLFMNSVPSFTEY